MALTVENIRSKASGLAAFQKGEQYYKEKKVEILQVDQFWKGEIGIKANAKGSNGERYKITLLVKKDKIYDYTCTCKAYKKYNGMCKHCVAAALTYKNEAGKSFLTGVSTAREIRQMLTAYTGREVAEVLAKKEGTKVSLVPKLVLQRERVMVEFRVGRDRLYVIKDLSEFILAVEKGLQIEYGKNLSFYHTPDAFDAQSRSLVSMIRDIIENYGRYHKRTHGWSSSGVAAVRELELTYPGRDCFFGLFLGQKLELETMKGEKLKVLVKDEDPQLNIEIRKKGRDGITIRMDEPLAAFFGELHFYVCSKDCLYRCSKEYMDAVGIFLDGYMNSYTGADAGLDINKKDLPAFCGQILPKLQAYATVIAEEEAGLEEFKPKPLEVIFKLDSESPGQITMEPILRYGERLIPAVEEGRGIRDVYRDVSGELQISGLVKEYFKKRTTEGRLIIDEDEEALFNFLEEGLPRLQQAGQVEVSEAFCNLKILPPPKVAVGVSVHEGWLDLRIDIGDLEREELQGLLENFRRHRKFHRLRNGNFIQLEENGIYAAAELIDGLHLSEADLQNGHMNIPKYRALYVDHVVKESKEVMFDRDNRFRSVIRELKSAEDNDFQVPKPLAGILRGYQKIGFKWLKTLDHHGFGGILADDMGLGKTIQVIAMLLYEKEQNKAKKSISLIICPASLVYNWEHEVAQFGFGLTTSVIAGNAAERRQLIRAAGDKDILITSYDLLKRDVDCYKEQEFRYQIIDEAQFIKNASTQSAKAVKEIRAVGRFALTGTPIENRLSELWSIFDYLMPGLLYSYQKFRRELELPIVKGASQEALTRLHRMIGPFILRRLKRDVLKELPDKLENVIITKFAEEQRKLYLANALILKRLLEEGSDSEFAAGKIQILAELTKLRQLCCDPRLCYENYADGSAKLETCMELILNGIEGGHKILLFSQFTSMLALIEERLQAEQVVYYKITGATKKEERMNQVNAFNKDQVPIFLISLKAGGTGLNLTAADMVIHYDPWWNVAAQNQATDRAHRIGQTNVVSVFKLIAKDTVEENILKLQESKKNLADQVIQGGMVSLGALSREELLDIIGS